MLSDVGEETAPARFGEVKAYAAAMPADLTIITYGNGTYFSRRCQKALAAKSVHADVVDLCWLSPLPIESVMKSIDPAKPILIVDECRESGSPSEELITRLLEADVSAPMRRLTGDDSYVPLGPAANEVLLQEDDIMAAALDMVPDSKGAQ